MDIHDCTLLSAILMRHGQPEGRAINAYGTPEDREDFIYFTVFPDRLQFDLKRILTGVASLRFRFTLYAREGAVRIERTLLDAEGANRRIRGALGDHYTKDKIGVPFDDVSEDEREWVASALRAFHAYFMKPATST